MNRLLRRLCPWHLHEWGMWSVLSIQGRQIRTCMNCGRIAMRYAKNSSGFDRIGFSDDRWRSDEEDVINGRY